MIPLLDAALERIKPYLEKTLEEGNDFTKESNYRGEETYNYFTGGPRKGHVARLRLDWELAHPMPSGLILPHRDVVHLMTWQMRQDLIDLLHNGDTKNATDPLLRSLDGIRKRGHQPVAIDIFDAHLFTEYKERRKSMEYTLYLLLYVEWPDALDSDSDS